MKNSTKNPTLPRLLSLAKALLPWIVAAFILFYLFRKIPPQQLVTSLKRVSLLPFILFSLAYFLIVSWIDTWGLRHIIQRFCQPVSFSKLWSMRCISYLISIVNYNAGQAGLAAALKRQLNTSFFRLLGSIFFITATDLYWIIILAFSGSFFLELYYQGYPIHLWAQRIGYIAIIAFFLHLAFWQNWFSKLIPFKIKFSFGDWVRGRHLFQAFHHAKIKDYLRIALMRLPLHIIFITSFWVLVRIFGAEIHWQEIITTVPIIFLIGTLPITPGGLGTVQFATVELLKNKISGPGILPGSPAAEEMLLALSLAWMGANYLIKALAGLLFLFLKTNASHQNANE